MKEELKFDSELKLSIEIPSCNPRIPKKKKKNFNCFPLQVVKNL